MDAVVLLPSPMFDRWFAWTGLMLEPGRWQLLQVAALAVFAGGFAAQRPRGARVAPIALGALCAALFACLLDPTLRVFGVLSGRDHEPLFRGVIVSYGALAGLVAGVALAEKLASRSAAYALDALALPLGGVVALSRLGCFVAGCDFGRPTSLPIGVVYGPNTPAFAAQRDAGLIDPGALHAMPVHPTQLYEVGAGVLMIGVALFARRRTKLGAGGTFALVAGTYAALRFSIELLRGDPSTSFLGVRLAGWLSLAVLGGVASSALGASSDRAPARAADQAIGRRP